MRNGIWQSASALAVAIAIGFSGGAQAGNIVLTGHDNDFHEAFGSAASNAAFLASLAFVKNGSTLPVLTFDAGSELTGVLTSLGQSYVNVNPNSLFSDSVFDNSLYSAFVVASEQSCGGCDNSPAANANIATHLTAIANFFNLGGGIYGLAGAADPLAYAYVPESATNPGGSPPSSGYVATAAGIALGIPAVNGDPTHNFFNEPGTGGLSPAYVVTERLGNAVTGTPETIALVGGTISCTVTGTCTITTGVPEPGTLALFGIGLIAVGALRRRRNYTSESSFA